MVDTLTLARSRHPGAKHSLDALCMRFGIDRSHRVKHGALLDAQLLAQVYVELTGGRQIGLGLVADSRQRRGRRRVAGPVTIREPRPARPHFAAAEELERHRAFIAKLVNPLWARFAERRLTRGLRRGPKPRRARLKEPDKWTFGSRVIRSIPASRCASMPQRRIAEITEKYFSRAVGANVTFGRGPNNDFTCDIVAPVVQGVVLKASHSGREPEMAFNGAADRIEKQLRRYTNRLKDHKVDDSGAGLSSRMPATRSFRRRTAEDETKRTRPTIVAETRVDIPESSVSDAVMLMDLRNTNALMFKNSGTGEFNMIYRREDGNIGWVEPHAD